MTFAQTSTSIPWAEGVRIAIHVVAACVWVGGQIVLAGLVPTIRRNAPQALSATARGFARLAWPAYAILVVTGIWNLWSFDLTNRSFGFLAVLFAKLLMVAVAGVATFAHSTTQKVSVRAIGGAVALVASLATVYLGVVLTLS